VSDKAHPRATTRSVSVVGSAPPRSHRIHAICSAMYATFASMASAPPPLSLRLGREGLNALEQIARRRGVSRAEAARQAITETAERDRRRAGLADEARRLMEDPAYLHEAREVASMMEDLRGPW
jgi:hypothetical protein